MAKKMGGYSTASGKAASFPGKVTGPRKAASGPSSGGYKNGSKSGK